MKFIEGIFFYMSRMTDTRYGPAYRSVRKVGYGIKEVLILDSSHRRMTRLQLASGACKPACQLVFHNLLTMTQSPMVQLFHHAFKRFAMGCNGVFNSRRKCIVHFALDQLVRLKMF
jgi:hypothetical protein